MRKRTPKNISVSIEDILIKVNEKFKFKRVPTEKKEVKKETRKEMLEYYTLPLLERKQIEDRKREKEREEANYWREENLKIKRKRNKFISELCEEHNISVSHIMTIGGFNKNENE